MARSLLLVAILAVGLTAAVAINNNDDSEGKALLHKLVEKIRSGEVKVANVKESPAELRHQIERIEEKKVTAADAEKEALDAEELGVAAKLAAKLKKKGDAAEAQASGSESSESSAAADKQRKATPGAVAESKALEIIGRADQLLYTDKVLDSESSGESGSDDDDDEESGEESSESGKREKGTGLSLRELEHDLATLAQLERKATGTTLQEIRVEMELILNRIRKLQGEPAPTTPKQAEAKAPTDHINHKLDPLIAHLVTLRMSENGLHGMLPIDVKDLEVHVRALLMEIEKHNGEPIDALPQTSCDEEPCEHTVVATSSAAACAEGEVCGSSQKVTPTIVEKRECVDNGQNNCASVVVASSVSSCNQCAEILATCQETCKVTPCIVNKCEKQHDECHAKCPVVKAGVVSEVRSDVVKGVSTSVRTDVIKPQTVSSVSACASTQNC
jgi:hypothetical protein